MYGNINRYRTAATGNAHNINNAVHCSFLVQDITPAGAGVIRALPRIFIADAGKAANTDVITDNTAAGAATVDVLTVAAHSLIDVGPIVNGNTRAAADISPWVGATPVRRPMRSLHYNVVFTFTAPAVSVDVVITHRLGTANTVAFVSPSADPVDAGAAGDLCNFWTTATAANTTTIRMGLASGGAPVAPTTVTCDVMILARWGSGLHSRYVRQHSATVAGAGAVPTYVDGDDYSGATGCRQLTPAQAQGFRGNPSYGALYTNIDAIVNAGLEVFHNMGSSTGAMCLFSHVADIGLNKPAIQANATSVNSMTLQNAVVAAMNDEIVGFFRPYSPVVRP